VSINKFGNKVFDLMRFLFTRCYVEKRLLYKSEWTVFVVGNTCHDYANRQMWDRKSACGK
jgi:hypothetical protein